MKRTLWGAAALACASLAGCARDQGACLFESHGACIQFTYDASAIPDLRARVDRLLELEMAFWDVHSLNGWTVQFRDTSHYDCYLNMTNSGCTNYFDQEMSVFADPQYGDCFEAAPLLHELGHYTLGDPTHSDPRWRDVPGAFAAMVWNRPDAAVSCVAYFHGITDGMWPVHFNGF